MHAEPAPKALWPGVGIARLNGQRLINHDGATGNFQASLFFDPETRVGVYMTANIVSALDTVASAHGTSNLDGISTRNMAETVLAMVTAQPLPGQGIGIGRLSIGVDLLLLGLSGALIYSLARLPAWRKRLARRGIVGQPDLIRLGGKTALLHFSGPLALLYIALGIPGWIVFVMFEPDLVPWASAAAGLWRSGSGQARAHLARVSPAARESCPDF